MAGGFSGLCTHSVSFSYLHGDAIGKSQRVYMLNLLCWTSFLLGDRLDRGDLIKAKPITSKIPQAHLSQTSATLPDSVTSKEKGENWANIPKVFFPLQICRKHKSGREQLAPGLQCLFLNDQSALKD